MVGFSNIRNVKVELERLHELKDMFPKRVSLCSLLVVGGIPVE